MIATGDEDSLRFVPADRPGNEEAIEVLAEMLVGRGDTEEALAFWRESPRTSAPARSPRRAASGSVHRRPRRDAECVARSGERTTTKRVSSSSTSSS